MECAGRLGRRLADDVRTGIRVVWHDTAIRALFLVTATLSFCMSFMASLYTLFALSHLGLGPAQLGVTIGMRPTLWALAIGVALAALWLVAVRRAIPGRNRTPVGE